jgi:hypothetical protein
MTKRSGLKFVALSAVFLLFIAGCGGGKDISTGAPTTPFLGGSNGLSVEFLEGSPPTEVTDGNSFDFQALVKLKNNGEHKFSDAAGTPAAVGDIKIDLIGFSPNDFRSNICTGDGTTSCTVDTDCTADTNKCVNSLCTGDGTTACAADADCTADTNTCPKGFTDADLQGISPTEAPTPRQRDSEGNIIEPVETFVEFPKAGKNFKFKESLSGNTVFIFRADVCYKYQTKAVSEICVLENQIDVADGAICDPSGSKTIFSSGSPLQVTSFRQSVVGKDKLQISFDVVHSGSGGVFDPATAADCPKDPTNRRNKEDKVKVTVNTGAATGGLTALDCVSLSPVADTNNEAGTVKLVNGKRTITCTQNLDPGRSDFQKPVEITVDFNYLESADTEVLVKHLVS